MNKIAGFITLFLLSIPIWPEKIAEFDLLASGPMMLKMNDHYYALCSPKDAKVSVYDHQSLTLISQFGKVGEGPGEFQLGMQNIALIKDKILISSMKRLSVFNAKGAFIRDFPVEIRHFFLGAVGDNYLFMYTTKPDENNQYHEIFALYDQNMTVRKTLVKRPLSRKSILNQTELYPRRVLINNDSEHFVVADQRGSGEITVYDQNGTEIGEVQHKFETIPVSNEIKNKIIEERKKIEKDDQKPSNRASVKTEYLCPDTFPPFLFIHIDGSSLFVYTYDKNPQKIKLLCFDIYGKYLGVIQRQKGQIGDPYRGFFYHLEENEETELYELHRWPIGKPVL